MRYRLAVRLACSLFVATAGARVSAQERATRNTQLPPPSRSLASYVDSGQMPGVAIALVDESGVLWSQGYGHANLARHTKVTADTSFWLASVTKTVTALALMHAEEHGALSLDTDVRALVASRAGFSLGSEAHLPILLRDLVTHTSPIRDGVHYACSYHVAAPQGPKQSLARLHAWYFAGLSGLPESFAKQLCRDDVPGDLGGFLRSYLSPRGPYFDPEHIAHDAPGAHVYSNVGAALAGYALELATGSSLADYAREHIFAPLRMHHTSWTLDALARVEARGSACERRTDIATPYGWDAKRAVHVPLPFYDLATSPDGGLRTSANDLGRLLSLVIRGGELDGVRVLQRETVGRMLAPMVRGPAGETGVFWVTRTDQHGATQIGHSGSDPGANTLMQFDPRARVGFVLLSNADSTALTELSASELATELLDAARTWQARKRN